MFGYVKKKVIVVLLVMLFTVMMCLQTKTVAKAFYREEIVSSETTAIEEKDVKEKDVKEKVEEKDVKEEIIEDVVELARTQIGKEYTWGGKGDIITDTHYQALLNTYGDNYYPLGKDAYIGKQGFDCSGLIYWAYNTVTGVEFGTYTEQQKDILSNYKVNNIEDIKVGDIIFTPGHVVMYIGNDTVIHASNVKAYPQGGIKESDITKYIDGDIYRPLDFVMSQK